MINVTPSVFLHRDTCNVYIIKNGRDAVLVDFGDGSVLQRLPALGIDRVTDVLMTHHHRDQGQGLHLAVKAGARIWAPHTEQDLFHSADEFWQAREVTNSYNNREDRFSLLESIPVSGTLKDYAVYEFGGHSFSVLPTPGHTTGSITLVVLIDGLKLAFTGDLIAGPGKVWSLAATQWSYNGGEGIPGSILSLLDVREQEADLLLPSHGDVIKEPRAAIDLTVERLAGLRELRRQNPRLFLLRETPYEEISPHLLKNRTSFSDAYVLLSNCGKAMMIDFGYDFMFGMAMGQDRASRRPWLQTIPVLKREWGVNKIDVVLPTHYHDDHVAGINLLRDVEGAEHWCPQLFADVLERPTHYDLPCSFYDPIPVDRQLPLGVPIRWEEYEFTLYPLPGHTYYAVAILVEVDGKRVMFAGDQWADGNAAGLNYAYKNAFRHFDYRETAELLRELKPDVILTGHWGWQEVTPEFIEQALDRGIELERRHVDLLPEEQLTFGARINPYQVPSKAGKPVTLMVTVANPFERTETALVRLAAPEGWLVTPGAAEVQLAPGAEGTATFEVIPTGPARRRARVATDITLGGVRYGQRAEALVNVLEGDGVL